MPRRAVNEVPPNANNVVSGKAMWLQQQQERSAAAAAKKRKLMEREKEQATGAKKQKTAKPKPAPKPKGGSKGGSKKGSKDKGKSKEGAGDVDENMYNYGTADAEGDGIELEPEEAPFENERRNGTAEEDALHSDEEAEGEEELPGEEEERQSEDEEGGVDGEIDGKEDTSDEEEEEEFNISRRQGPRNPPIQEPPTAARSSEAASNRMQLALSKCY